MAELWMPPRRTVGAVSASVSASRTALDDNAHGCSLLTGRQLGGSSGRPRWRGSEFPGWGRGVRENGAIIGPSAKARIPAPIPAAPAGETVGAVEMVKAMARHSNKTPGKSIKNEDVIAE